MSFFALYTPTKKRIWIKILNIKVKTVIEGILIYTISLKISKAYIEHLSFRAHLWFSWIFISKIYVIHYQERATQPNSNGNLKTEFIRQKLRVWGNFSAFFPFLSLRSLKPRNDASTDDRWNYLSTKQRMNYAFFGTRISEHLLWQPSFFFFLEREKDGFINIIKQNKQMARSKAIILWAIG